MFFVFSLLWAVGTCLYSAHETSLTADEWIYQTAGTHYLKTGDFSMNFEHPPLSKWTGALVPTLLGKTELFYFRIFHIGLFAVVGSLIFAYFFYRKMYVASFIWCALFFFCPNFKAMSSLHITDADVALYAMLGALALYEFQRQALRRDQILLLILSTSCLVFTITSKFTGLIFVPFFLIALWLSKGPGMVDRKTCLGIVLVTAMAGFMMVYLFHPTQILWFGKGIDAQKLHNRAADHATSLWGQTSVRGFWYYYIVGFLFKSSVLQLLAVTTAVAVLFKNVRSLKKEALFFLLPALILFAYLSRLNVQLGYRYALPFVGLVFIFAAFAFEKLQQHSSVFLSKGFMFVLALLLWGVDIKTFASDGYLSFFNSFTPSPARNFADGNNDWGQRFNSRFVPGWGAVEVRDIDDIHREMPAIVEMLLTQPKKLEDSVTILVGASDLAGLFKPEGYFFRALSPHASRGAFEVYEITWREYFTLLLASDTQLRPRFQNPTVEEMEQIKTLKLCHYRLEFLKGALKDTDGKLQRKWHQAQSSQNAGALSFTCSDKPLF